MDINVKNNLDPFRIIIGVLATRGDSDLLVGVVNAVGLRVDLRMPESKDFSHKTRIRALLPRILAAYDELEDQARMAAANVAFRNFGPSYPGTRDRAVKALELAGWQVRDDELVVSSPDLREMFFPKGSPWDAHVAIRGVLNEAKQSIMIVDSYIDGTVFQMLVTRVLTGLRVCILCGTSGPAVAAEASTFMAQHSGVIVEVRQARDFHDRFIVIDNQTCIHVGASIKDAGKTACMVSRVEDDKNRLAILSAISDSWATANQLL